MALCSNPSLVNIQRDGSLALGLLSASSAVFSAPGAPTQPLCPQGEIYLLHQHYRAVGNYRTSNIF